MTFFSFLVCVNTSGPSSQACCHEETHSGKSVSMLDGLMGSHKLNTTSVIGGREASVPRNLDNALEPPPMNTIPLSEFTTIYSFSSCCFSEANVLSKLWLLSQPIGPGTQM